MQAFGDPLELVNFASVDDAVEFFDGVAVDEFCPCTSFFDHVVKSAGFDPFLDGCGGKDGWEAENNSFLVLFEFEDTETRLVNAHWFEDVVDVVTAADAADCVLCPGLHQAKFVCKAVSLEEFNNFDARDTDELDFLR